MQKVLKDWFEASIPNQYDAFARDVADTAEDMIDADVSVGSGMPIASNVTDLFFRAGNDADRARTVREALTKAGLAVLGYGLSSTGESWAMIVQAPDLPEIKEGDRDDWGTIPDEIDFQVTEVLRSIGQLPADD